MKYLFATVFAVLVVASVAWYAWQPDVRSDLPVLYWVTDNNPARGKQIATFHDWMIAHGHGSTVTIASMDELAAFRERNYSANIRDAIRRSGPDGEAVYAEETGEGDLPLRVTVPRFELRLDTGNRATRKQLIQGVAGMASDLMDIGPGHLGYLQSTGMLEDITEPAQRMGFSPDDTFEAIEPQITVDGRQYTFPANLGMTMLWVNESTFREHDQPLPPQRWTLEKFEKRGKAFVNAANAGQDRHTVFFCNHIDLKILFRSLGLSAFNETRTRCTLDDARFARALRLKRQWTYEDQLLPSSAQAASFSTAEEYGGSTFQLFSRGNYAMVMSGRYALIQLREFGDLSLSVVEPPHGGFVNTTIFTRGVSVYAGGEHPDLAHRFLQYLGSEAYNMQIVRDADALPPNPKFTKREAFLRPPEHENEWGTHERFAKAARNTAIANVASPFVLSRVVQRLLGSAESKVMANRLSPKEAAAECARRINAEIEQTVSAQPKLRDRYEKLRARQQKIDARRQAGKPIPPDWIDNTFLRRYYRKKGWLATPASGKAESREENR